MLFKYIDLFHFTLILNQCDIANTKIYESASGIFDYGQSCDVCNRKIRKDRNCSVDSHWHVKAEATCAIRAQNIKVRNIIEMQNTFSGYSQSIYR